MANVSLKNAVKRYGDVSVIHGVDLELNHGEFIVFVGPSGCGKSTLLRMIAGLEEITEGEIHINDRDVTHVPAVDRGIAMVFQSYALYPHMSVKENMSFGLRMNGVARDIIETKVQAAAKTLQLDQLLDRKPKNLSGGQRQRVAIGRAIVRDPQVFLFDEPLSNLDAELRVEMRLQIAKLRDQLDATMIYVTHDQVEAMTLADRIVVLRAGRIEQVGSPLELYTSPANQFVAGFIGSPKMNFLDGDLVQPDNQQSVVRLQDGTELPVPYDTTASSQGAKVSLGIRPEDLARSQGSTSLNIDVDVVERLGGATFLYGRCAGQANFAIEREGTDSTRAGDHIEVMFPEARSYLFNTDGIAYPRVAG